MRHRGLGRPVSQVLPPVPYLLSFFCVLLITSYLLLLRSIPSISKTKTKKTRKNKYLSLHTVYGCSPQSHSSLSGRSYTTKPVYKRSPLPTRASHQWGTPGATITPATATIIIIISNNNIVRKAAGNVTPTPQMVAKPRRKQTTAAAQKKTRLTTGTELTKKKTTGTR